MKTIQKSIILIIIFLVTLISLSAISAADIHNITSDMDRDQIQGVLDSASNGSVINFNESNTYQINGTLDIRKSFNITSNVKPILNGNGSGICFNVLANYVNISNLVIQNFDVGIGQSGTGTNVDYNRIINNTIRNNAYGIFIHGSNSYVFNNTVYNNTKARVITFENQYENYGITLWGRNTTVANNTVELNKYGIVNYGPGSYIVNNTVKFSSPAQNLNIVMGAGYAGIANTLYGDGSVISNNIVENNYNYGIRNDCDNVIIENNILTNNTNYGIYNSNVNHGQNATGNLVIIRNNTIDGVKRNSVTVKGHGIYNEGFKALITNNTLTNCANDGILITPNGNMTTIENNNIYNNNRTGIRFEGLIGTIYNNQVHDNLHGVHLFSTLTSLNGNGILDNKGSGIIIQFNNSNLNIFNNTIKRNNLALNITGNNNTIGINSSNKNLLNEISENNNGILVNGYENKISHMNIYNNTGTGFIVVFNNNTIETCNVINNSIGFNITGNNSKINYNRIYNNSIIGMTNNGLNTNANLNWWGYNNIFSQYMDNSGDINLTNHFVIQIMGNDFKTIITGERINFTAGTNVTYIGTLVLNDSNVRGVDKTKLPHFNVIWTNSNNSTISGDIRYVDLVGSVVGKGNDSYKIKGLSDSTSVDLEIYFNASDVKPTKVEIKDFVSKVGKTVKLNATLKDKNGNPLSNKYLNFYINLGNGWIFIGKSLTNSQGIAFMNYIPKTKGKFPVMAIFEGDEEYINSTNSSYLTVKVMKPDVDNNKTNETNKTSKTNKTQRKQVISEAAMKKTGIQTIPIAILVLLSSLGLIVRRR